MISKEEFERRLNIVEQETGMGRLELSVDLGYGPSRFSEILGPNGKLTERLLEKFDLKYGHLYTALPPMKPTNNTVQLLDMNGKLIPLNDQRTNVLPDYEKLIVDHFKSNNQATHIYRIEDLTMHSIFFPSDLLILVEADTSIIIAGELFVIEFLNGKTVVRYIHYNEKDPSLFDLKAYNKSVGVTPGIPRDAIKRMFKIVHLSRKLESTVNNSVVAFQKAG